MLTWELVGAVVGAGLASGREIASFFTQYGTWSYLGIGLAVSMLVFLGNTSVPVSWKKRWPESLWKGLLSLLLVATGGAMLSGAGEIFALTLPIRSAHMLGMAVTLVIAWFLARKTTAGLAWISRILLVVLVMMITWGLFLPPQRATSITADNGIQSTFSGLTYGGFNAALQVSILEISTHTERTHRNAAVHKAGMLIMLLLLLGNAVLLRHPALLDEAVPFLRMLSAYGYLGYYLGATCLFLAILSTLTACLRGLNGSLFPILAVIIVSLLGFTGVVEWTYPVLGGICFIMLLMAKFTNCSANPFHSRRDML